MCLATHLGVEVRLGAGGLAGHDPPVHAGLVVADGHYLGSGTHSKLVLLRTPPGEGRRSGDQVQDKEVRRSGDQENMMQISEEHETQTRRSADHNTKTKRPRHHDTETSTSYKMST